MQITSPRKGRVSWSSGRGVGEIGQGVWDREHECKGTQT